MKAVNKDKITIKLNSKEFLVIDKIEPPKFFIGDIELTEYDARNLQLEVCKGNISHEILNNLPITDAKGQKFIFNPNGTLQNTPFGYKVLGDLAIQLLNINSDKANAEIKKQKTK